MSNNPIPQLRVNSGSRFGCTGLGLGVRVWAWLCDSGSLGSGVRVLVRVCEYRSLGSGVRVWIHVCESGFLGSCARVWVVAYGCVRTGLGSGVWVWLRGQLTPVGYQFTPVGYCLHVLQQLRSIRESRLDSTTAHRAIHTPRRSEVAGLDQFPCAGRSASIQSHLYSRCSRHFDLVVRVVSRRLRWIAAPSKKVVGLRALFLGGVCFIWRMPGTIFKVWVAGKNYVSTYQVLFFSSSFCTLLQQRHIRQLRNKKRRRNERTNDGVQCKIKVHMGLLTSM